MERSVQHRIQYVGLPTACAVVYSHVSGQVPDARQPAAMQAILNDVARALSSLVPIYVHDRLARGAHVFVTQSGVELRGLAVQRGDLWSAIAILKSTGICFARRDNPANE